MMSELGEKHGQTHFLLQMQQTGSSLIAPNHHQCCTGWSEVHPAQCTAFATRICSSAAAAPDESKWRCRDSNCLQATNNSSGWNKKKCSKGQTLATELVSFFPIHVWPFLSHTSMDGHLLKMVSQRLTNCHLHPTSSNQLKIGSGGVLSTTFHLLVHVWFNVVCLKYD